MERQHDMAHKTVRHTKEQKQEQQLEEERVTIQNLKVIHVHRIINQEQDDRLIQERQVLEHLNTVKLKVLRRIERVLREVLQVHIVLLDHLRHVHQELFDLQVLHLDHQAVVAVQLEVRLLEEGKLSFKSGY